MLIIRTLLINIDPIRKQIIFLKDKDSDSDSNTESVENLKGITLVEVFNIIYLGADEVPPEKQLGTISIESNHRQYLYKVDTVDMKRPSIKFGDPITVTMEAPIIGYVDYDIVFNLFCGAYTGRVEIEWPEEYQYDFPYEALSYEDRIKSDDGTGQICVQSGVFANATIANVEIKLGKCGFANVHGYVMASNSRLDLPTRASILFWMKTDNGIQVRDGLIPLSKSRVGVPLDSEFYLAISLVCDNEDFTTKVTLIPEEAGIWEGIFCNNKLQVRVTWDATKE